MTRPPPAGLVEDLARLAERIERAPATGGGRALVLFAPMRVDEVLVDHGHRFLDWLLDGFHARIEATPLTGGSAMPLGRDRHAVVLEGLQDPDLALLAARRVQRSFTAPFTRSAASVRMDVLAGITVVDGDLDVEELARRCEVALLQAARLPEQVAFFDAHGPAATGVTRLREQIRSGLERAEFQLFYQPLVRGHDMHPLSTEGLVRWHRGGVMLMPTEFVPLMENSSLVVPFTRHCVDTGIRQCADWASRGLRLGVSINVPPAAVSGRQMIDMVEDALDLFSPPPELITLELTETAIMEDPRRCLETLRALRALGVRISLDDFGTGHSSLAYFRDLPVDELKIDQSFTSGLAADERARMLVGGITRLAHAFGLTVVAEGVETEETRRILLDVEVDSMQGWLFAPALRPGDLEIWARHFRAPGGPRPADSPADATDP